MNWIEWSSRQNACVLSFVRKFILIISNAKLPYDIINLFEETKSNETKQEKNKRSKNYYFLFVWRTFTLSKQAHITRAHWIVNGHRQFTL